MEKVWEARVEPAERPRSSIWDWEEVPEIMEAAAAAVLKVGWLCCWGGGWGGVFFLGVNLFC